MRYLVYLLVIVNLVYFSWHMLQGDSDDGANDELLQLPPDTRRLMTLQELREQQNKREASGEAATKPDDQAESPAELELELELEPEPVAGIETLTELQPPAAGVPLNCYSLGPFMAENELGETTARLDAMGLEATRRSEEREIQIGYWIYLPAMPRVEALEYKAKLDKHKDKEDFIGKDNVLSLGAFREKSRADRRMRQVRKIGIKPVMEPRYKTRDVFWLDLVEGLTATDHENLVSEMSGVDIQPQDCR